MSPDPTKVNAADQLLTEVKGPSGFGSATAEERTLKAADAGVAYTGWATGPTGPQGRTGTSPTGATGPTGP